MGSQRVTHNWATFTFTLLIESYCHNSGWLVWYHSGESETEMPTNETTHLLNWVLWGTSNQYHEKNFLQGGFTTERERRTGSIQKPGKVGTQWKNFGMKTRPFSGLSKLGRCLKWSCNLTSSYYWWGAWDKERSRDLLKATQQVGKSVLHHHILLRPGPAELFCSQQATWREWPLTRHFEYLAPQRSLCVCLNLASCKAGTMIPISHRIKVRLEKVKEPTPRNRIEYRSANTFLCISAWPSILLQWGPTWSMSTFHPQSYVYLGNSPAQGTGLKDQLIQ